MTSEGLAAPGARLSGTRKPGRSIIGRAALARQMVGRWGMSEKLGLVSVLPGPGQEGLFFPGTSGASSERTRELVDEEVRRITDECYDHAVQILREHRDQLDSLAEALLEHETLDEPDAYRAAGLPARSAGAEAERQPVASGDSGRSDLETERR